MRATESARSKNARNLSRFFNESGYNKKNCSLCSNKKSFQKLDEHARVYAAFFLDHEPHVPFRCNRRNQTKAVASTGRLDDGRFALLAPCTPRVMIRTHVGGVAKIDVCALVLSHLSDLRVFRLQPFLHQSLITLQRAMQRLLRRDAKLGQQAANR